MYWPQGTQCVKKKPSPYLSGVELTDSVHAPPYPAKQTALMDPFLVLQSVLFANSQLSDLAQGYIVFLPLLVG